MTSLRFMTLAVAAAALPFTVTAASADDANHFAPQMELFLSLTVQAWVSDDVAIDAIRAQNSRTGDLSEAEILALDKKWRAAQVSDPIIADVLNNPFSDFLRTQSAQYEGVVTEVFVTDAKGLNVAATVPTSDYWQGDEAKHQESFGKGAGAIHIGGMEVDESTGVYQGQASMTISDPETGDPIGAITVGVLPEML
ncbi:hypothetical protein [Celeribacter sp.]|uniref:hypothetical protein n=1 Tax=Celeribacter sp. TaxID=1890673 RepID=UPI003A8DBA67